MSPPSDQNEMPPHIREVLERTRKEAERLREIYGDPEEVVSAFIRGHFTREAFEEVFQEMVKEQAFGMTMTESGHCGGNRAMSVDSEIHDRSCDVIGSWYKQMREPLSRRT